MNYSLLLLVFFVFVPYIHGTISDWRLCGDPECRGALSSGVASVNYQSIEPMVLSFNAGDEVIIYSKEAGQNKELWGAEVRGKRGYIPKRLIREMRIFLRNPSHTVPTELIQPSAMQPPNSQSTFIPQQLQQQPQQHPQLQQGGPQGNYNPYQQPPPPHMNPQFHNNNILPNQPVPIQHTPQLSVPQQPVPQQPVPQQPVPQQPVPQQPVPQQPVPQQPVPQQPVPQQSVPQQPVPQQPVPQQPKPLSQPPMQAVPLTTTTAASTTTTALPTEAQVPNEINQVVGIQDSIPTDVLSSEEPPVPIQSPKASVTVENVKSGNEDEDDVGEDEEGEETEEIDPNEQTEDELDDDDFIVEKTPTDQLSLDIKEINPEIQANLDPVTESVKTPTVDPVIEIVDLHGVNSSPIHAPHIRSLEESIDNPLVMKNEQLTVVETPISNKSEFIEDSQGPGIVVETIPEEENVTHDSVHDAFDEPRASNTVAEEDGNASQPLNWMQDGQSEPVIETISTDNEVINVVVSSPINDDLSQFNETYGADIVPASETVVEYLTPDPETFSDSEIVVSTEIPQTSLEPAEPVNLLSDSELVQVDVNLNQQPTELPEDEEKTIQVVLPNKEDLLPEEIKPAEESQQATEEISQEPVTPSTDLNPESLPVDLKTTSEDNKTPSPEGSGGGFIDSALNWLGLSDTDEPLKTDQLSFETTDPAPLLQQIASMNPTSNQEVEPAPKEVIPTVEEVNGFCDTQDCAKLVDVPDVAPKEDIHIHGEHGDAGHVLLQNHEDHHHNHDDHHHDHTHDSHDSHDHHHHENDGHDHHGHGHGHGHSHIPGYIPGFGHHYKPPVAKPQVVLPPSEIPTLPPPLPTIVEIVPEKFPELQPTPELPTPPPVVEEFNSLPPAVDEHLNQPVSVLEQTPPPAVGSVPNEVPAKESTVPEYIPVEEIFRQEMEKNRLLQEKQQQQEQNGEGMFDWLTVSLTSMFTSLNDAESFDGVSKTSLYPALVVSVTTVAFLMLYYSVQNKSVEKLLKARISLLDSQLYESQSANEESSSAQTKLSEYEINAAELRSQKEQAEAEKVALSRRLASLEKERDSLEKEVECATESATEANRMLEELLASQSENDQWQRSVEVLQQQLNRQQQTMESLNSSLCVKSAENETLVVEVEELRTESERYKVRIKTLQGDLENLKTSNRNYQQKMAQEGAELMKLKQEKEAWVSERRSLSSQVNRHAKEVEEWRDKAEQLKKSIKAKENDLAKSIELLKQSGNDSPTVLQLTSLVQLESELNEANQAVERLTQEVSAHSEESRRFETEKADIQQRLSELQATCEAAVKDKREAETRLEVLTNYFKEKETQLHKELGTHEAKRAITEENVSESVKKILETEESLTLYKSQVETLTKEIEEQERSYKSRLATQEKRAHENWVAARQLERRLDESKQEAAQLRHRLTQVEKDKEALLVAKENGTANGAVDVDLIKPVIKRSGLGLANNEELTMMEHPPLLSPPIPPPPPGMELGLGVPPPPPGMPFDSLFPPPHFIPPAPFMPPEAGMLAPLHLHMPSIPPPPSSMLADHHRPPPLGMIATGSFDVDYRRDMSDPPPPRRYPSPPRRYPSPLGSERSVRSDRSDRMDRYDDHFRPVSPYGRHGGHRPRSVGRSRDVSPERPRSYSPLPSPLYPPHTTVHSPQDWDDGRDYNHRPPMMRPGNPRHPQAGPKTSSPLIQPMDNGDRHHRPQPH